MYRLNKVPCREKFQFRERIYRVNKEGSVSRAYLPCEQGFPCRDRIYRVKNGYVSGTYVIIPRSVGP